MTEREIEFHPIPDGLSDMLAMIGAAQAELNAITGISLAQISPLVRSPYAAVAEMIAREFPAP